MLLRPFGSIKNIKIKKNQRGGSKGYCIVTASNIFTAQKLLEKGNIWLDDRLLSIRKVLSYKERNERKNSNHSHRVIAFGFPLEMSEGTKTQIREFFSSQGELSYFYYLKVNMNRIDDNHIYRWYEQLKESSISKRTKYPHQNSSFNSKSLFSKYVH